MNWISVEDRLPSNGQEVFIKDAEQIGTATFKTKYTVDFKTDNNVFLVTGTCYFEPTHWASAYDSENDTLKHIKRVSQLMTEAAIELIQRANIHDDSKLKSPEKEKFDEYTPKLAGSTYGSDEYKELLKRLGSALTHHYKNNSHHPEHYENGINDMNLFDVLEMFFDWKAASERHNDGDIYKSITHNKGRFEMSDQLEKIFINTAKKLDY